jgi:hypothetical protein
VKALDGLTVCVKRGEFSISGLVFRRPRLPSQWSGVRPSSPLHFSRQSAVVSTSANLQSKFSKAASAYCVVLPFSSVECEKFYVIVADYLTPKIFHYKGLLSGRDSTLISRMRSDHHLSRMNQKLCAGDSPGIIYSCLLALDVGRRHLGYATGASATRRAPPRIACRSKSFSK